MSDSLTPQITKKEQAKTAVKQLIEKYERVKSQERAKEYSEQTTNKDFIMPLFEALGWDVYNKKTDDEVTAEESVSKKRVDFAFRLNGMARLFLECKALKVDLEQEKWAEQATNYAHIKGVVWAALTNFESIKIFNSQLKSEGRIIRPILEMSYADFLTRFDDLWLLSRESFETGFIDKIAEGRGQKFKKVPVGEQLLLDLTTWRSRLSKDVLERNKSKQLSEEDIDEAVQRILDRFIFIRKCEDSELEQPNLLLSKVREWEGNPRGFLAKHIFGVFSQFDKIYDSRLFLPHLCDDLEISNQVISEVINGLYHTKDRAIQYDFSAIDADVLGSVYEQYLGHILKKTAKRATVTEKHAHRKEQGIYYTPTYIVDYIVKNTLGELLKTKSPKEAEKIRVLDPACGSGSFLIKTFDVFDRYFKKAAGSQQELEFARRSKILTENIFGVDLDPKAVEIAQLNLLLKTAEKKEKLPMLQNNIKCGNSLIDDPAVAGEARAFKWDSQFQKIMNQEGGFDVIVGNPPYVRIQTLGKNDVEFFNTEYKSSEKGNYDIYVLFVEKALKLLKDGGYLGFILPHKFFTSKYGEPLRKFISEGKYLYEIIHFGDQQVFEGATTYTCLLFLRKKENPKFKFVKVDNLDTWRATKEAEQGTVNATNATSAEWNFTVGKNAKLFEKLSKMPVKLANVIERAYQGPITSADNVYLFKEFRAGKTKATTEVFSKQQNKWITIESNILKAVVRSGDIGRYRARPTTQVLFPYAIEGNSSRLFTPEEMQKTYPLAWNYLNLHKHFLETREKESFKDIQWYRFGRTQNLGMWEQSKLMIPYMVTALSAYLDLNENFYFINVTTGGYGIVTDEKQCNYVYLCGLLNSKLLNFYFKRISTNFHGGYFAANKQYIEQLPIHKVDFSNQKEKGIHDQFVKLVKHMLSLNKRLLEIGDNKTDERARVEEEIKRTDAEIDELVYKLYGITDEEKKIIEESLKK